MTRRWIPDPTDLGPDPEPCGQRFECLLAQAPEPVKRGRTPVAVQPPAPPAPELVESRQPDHVDAELALV
jgi:hypothetical protein